jgi:uncharacterized protein (TIGR02246 family)
MAIQMYDNAVPGRSTLALGCLTKRSVKMDDEAAIRRLLEKWHIAIRAGDFRAVVELMTTDAVFLRAGQPALDRSAFIAAAADPPRWSPIVEFAGNIREIRVDKNFAYMWADISSATRTSRWTPLVRKRGSSLSVFRKESGNWLMAHSADTSIPVPADA